jgi:large subunit ribosomal protein L6
MSRVGKNPVIVPEGVSVQVSGQEVTAKGKLGQRSLRLVEEIEASLEDNQVWVKPRDDSKRARTMWGTSRSLVNSLVLGVGEGFTKQLEINGVGYRAAVQGNVLKLQLGYSHDVDFPIPDGIDIQCERPTLISVSGIDRQRVGQVAAEIRAFRKPEPYKGKGIRYVGEYVQRKEGKKK